MRDITAESDCELETRTDDGPWQSEPCPAGTVITTEPVTAARAARNRDVVVVTLTGNDKRDRAIVDQAAESLLAAIAPTTDVAAQQSCFDSSRELYASYGTPQDSDLGVRLNLRYDVVPSYTVRQIRDRSKTNSAADGLMRWLRSCSDGQTGQCSSRGIRLYSDWTAFECCLDNSGIGRTYWHHTDRPNCLTCPDYRFQYQFTR